MSCLSRRTVEIPVRATFLRARVGRGISVSDRGWVMGPWKYYMLSRDTSLYDHNALPMLVFYFVVFPILFASPR